MAAYQSFNGMAAFVSVFSFHHFLADDLASNILPFLDCLIYLWRSSTSVTLLSGEASNTLPALEILSSIYGGETLG